MKTAAITLLATVATIGLGISAPARADDSEMKLSGYEQPIEDISVTAQRLPSSAPVAVSGTVGELSRGGMIINSMSGPVKVTLANKYMPNAFGLRPVSAEFAVGDSVTAFGALRHGDMISVKPEALLLDNGAPKVKLIVMQEPPLASVQKMNTPINGRAALKALRDTHREL